MFVCSCSALWRCRRCPQLHHTGGGLAEQEIEVWVAYEPCWFLFKFQGWCFVWVKVAVLSPAGSSWTLKQWRKSTKLSKQSVSPWVRFTSPTVFTRSSHCFLNRFLLSALTEKRRKASPWQRNLGYPLAMLMLLALTVIIHNVLPGWLKSVLQAANETFGNICVSSGVVCSDGVF